METYDIIGPGLDKTLQLVELDRELLKLLFLFCLLRGVVPLVRLGLGELLLQRDELSLFCERRVSISACLQVSGRNRETHGVGPVLGRVVVNLVLEPLNLVAQRPVLLLKALDRSLQVGQLALGRLERCALTLEKYEVKRK